VRVLLTGAAGFVGTAVRSELEAAGHEVVATDAWIPQAHHGGGARTGRVEHRLDLRDPAGWVGLLAGVDAVCHQAAMVGAGTGPADLPLFAGHNDLGTAVLLAAMAEARVDRLVLASSMVVYGEGRYRCARHGTQRPDPRTTAALEAGDFECRCPRCEEPLAWELVDEDAPLDPRTGYAASKVAQEHFCGAWARQVDGHVVALRYHNVYGPHMPRDTPYSGVAAVFRSQVEAGRPPRVFEDGRQTRDFVHVTDVARANRLALEAVGAGPVGDLRPYNVCSGEPVTVLEVAEHVARGVGPGARPAPLVTGEFRAGDVRHVVASPARAAAGLGFTADVRPGEGLAAFARDPLR